MIKKLSYRKSKKGTAEQYNVSINQNIIKSMGITANDREVKLFFDKRSNRLIIQKHNKESIT